VGQIVNLRPIGNRPSPRRMPFCPTRWPLRVTTFLAWQDSSPSGFGFAVACPPVWFP